MCFFTDHPVEVSGTSRVLSDRKGLQSTPINQLSLETARWYPRFVGSTDQLATNLLSEHTDDLRLLEDVKDRLVKREAVLRSLAALDPAVASAVELVLGSATPRLDRSSAPGLRRRPSITPAIELVLLRRTGEFVAVSDIHDELQVLGLVGEDPGSRQNLRSTLASMLRTRGDAMERLERKDGSVAYTLNMQKYESYRAFASGLDAALQPVLGSSLRWWPDSGGYTVSGAQDDDPSVSRPTLVEAAAALAHVMGADNDSIRHALQRAAVPEPFEADTQLAEFARHYAPTPEP